MKWGIVGAVGVAGVAAASIASLPHEREIAAYGTPLDGRTSSQRHNARLSVERLNGARIAPGEAFSFNQRVGTFSRDAGFKKAPVSYNGQLIDDWGGGVCQTSTTLYNAALLAGMNIVERHRHQFAPTYVPPGRDAAVAFSNIDLRFQNPHDFPVRIEARMRNGVLKVAFVAARTLDERPQVYHEVRQSQSPATYRLGPDGPSRVRNSGKRGWEVAVYRVMGSKRQLVSLDNYPTMHRVVETKRTR